MGSRCYTCALLRNMLSTQRPKSDCGQPSAAKQTHSPKKNSQRKCLLFLLKVDFHPLAPLHLTEVQSREHSSQGQQTITSALPLARTWRLDRTAVKSDAESGNVVLDLPSASLIGAGPYLKALALPAPLKDAFLPLMPTADKQVYCAPPVLHSSSLCSLTHGPECRTPALPPPFQCHSDAAQEGGGGRGGGRASLMQAKHPNSPCLHLKAATTCSQGPIAQFLSFVSLLWDSLKGFQILVNFY